MINVGIGATGFIEVPVFRANVASLKEHGREEEGLLLPLNRCETIAMEASSQIMYPYRENPFEGHFPQRGYTDIRKGCRAFEKSKILRKEENLLGEFVGIGRSLKMVT